MVHGPDHRATIVFLGLLRSYMLPSSTTSHLICNQHSTLLHFFHQNTRTLTKMAVQHWQGETKAFGLKRHCFQCGTHPTLRVVYIWDEESKRWQRRSADEIDCPECQSLQGRNRPRFARGLIVIQDLPHWMTDEKAATFSA